MPVTIGPRMPSNSNITPAAESIPTFKKAARIQKNHVHKNVKAKKSHKLDIVEVDKFEVIVIPFISNSFVEKYVKASELKAIELYVKVQIKFRSFLSRSKKSIPPNSASAAASLMPISTWDV